MIRIVLALMLLAVGLPANAAPLQKDATAGPALLQCIAGVLARPSTEGEEDANTSLLSDCIGVGTNACQNTAANQPASVLVDCDERERVFWALLSGYALGELRTSLDGPALRSLEAEEAAWTPWLEARCDFVRLSIDDAEQSKLESSWCVMETTGQHAIDLVLALPGIG